MAASSSTSCRWKDALVSLLLESVRDRESLWNSRSEKYKNRNTKNKEHEEILAILREDWPDVELPTIKAKIQGLRIFYREEVRKIKKSKGTGTGVKDIYVSKWKFFEQCSFLDEVICAKHKTMTNVEEFEDYHVVDDNLDTATETESFQSVASSGSKRKNSCNDPVTTSATESVASSSGKRKNLAITLF